MADQLHSLFLYFSVSSLLGWILETAFRSFKDHHWVNAGFLSGPFVPIYGFGALAIAGLSAFLRQESWFAYWTLVLLSPSLIEYAVSLLLEKLFGLRLWDYSAEPFNLKGRVCLSFSLVWGLLTALTVILYEPATTRLIASLSPTTRAFASGALAMYFAMDTVGSVKAIVNYKAFIADLKDLVARGGAFIPSFDGEPFRLPREIHRLLRTLKAFPRLVTELKPMLHAIPERIITRLESVIGGHHFHK